MTVVIRPEPQEMPDEGSDLGVTTMPTSGQAIGGVIDSPIESRRSNPAVTSQEEIVDNSGRATDTLYDSAYDPTDTLDTADQAGPSDADHHGGLSTGALVIGWTILTLAGLWMSVRFVEPISEARAQRALLSQITAEMESASNQAFGLGGVETPTLAPGLGDPVAVIDVESIGLHRVVVEGAGVDETRQGPGHVVGTAGIGQPGNSVVVGRRSLFGGAFGSIADLNPGDRIVVSTNQGQSVYSVVEVGTRQITDADETLPLAASPSGASPSEVDTVGAGAAKDSSVDLETLYGPSDADQLTLVTAGSVAPWTTDRATVVVAEIEGTPFTPTPQGGRTMEQHGRQSQAWSSAGLTLALLCYLGAVVASIWLHRSVSWRSAYLVSTPLLLTTLSILSEQVSIVLPAWA